MIRGLHSAASGMFSLERRQEALSNNLANAQTPGFKADETVLRAFPNLLIQRIQDFQQHGAGAPVMPGHPVPIGELSNGVYAQERIPSFNQGALVETGQALDVAIEDQSIPVQEQDGRQVKPAAFFAVQLQDGSVGYTRNGKWDLDANGHIVTAEGYRVLGSDGQPVQLTDGVRKEDLNISSNGTITSNGMNVGQLGIAVVQNPFELRRLGGNVYEAENPVPLAQGQEAGVALHQGFMEQSNVDPGKTMAEMMMTVRGYEANQKVISVYDQSLQQVNSVGKING